MNVLFLTLLDFESLQEKNIYTDLLRVFVKNGHNVFVISPIEKRKHIDTHLVKENKTTILRIQIGNIQKTNIIEKGISTIMIGPSLKMAIKRYFFDVKFDFVMYTTPPITFVSAIEYVKKRDGVMSYLLLKDIFPQNAVDIGMLSTKGIRGILYKYFRSQEKKLYSVSDFIGCMSQANVEYVIKHNPEVDQTIVEVCPNAIEIIDMSVDDKTRKVIRTKYDIPVDKKVFIYGGNLGKPQGIPFLIECLRRCQDMDNVFFLIVGDGTEYHLLEEFEKKDHPKNIKLIKRLPKEEYESLVGACDVGLIFLDYRFTIPNFPSRLLSYMQAKIPVLAVTDTNTDIGKVIVEGGFGWWCESNNATKFAYMIKSICDMDMYSMKDMEFAFLQEHYAVESAYLTIVNH